MESKYLKLMLTILLCMFSIFLSAQGIHKLGKYKVGHQVYVVSPFGNGDKVSISGSSHMSTRLQKGNVVQVEFFPGFSSKETIKDAFISVLGKTRIKKLIPEKYIIIYYSFNTDGKIISLKYVLNKNSDFTPKEINRLTLFIKDNVSINVPKSLKGEGNKLCTPMTQLIRFSSLINENN